MHLQRLFGRFVWLIRWGMRDALERIMEPLEIPAVGPGVRVIGHRLLFEPMYALDTG